MQGCIRADGAGVKDSINLILVAVMMAALLFGTGCQKDSARISDAEPIRHAQLNNGGYDKPGRSQPSAGMVRLASIESLEEMGSDSVATAAATEGATPAGGASEPAPGHPSAVPMSPGPAVPLRRQ